MNIQSILKFVARGEAFRDEISAPVTITGTYDTLSTEPVRCTVLPDMDKLVDGLFSERRILQLRGRTELGKEIWIPEFQVENSSWGHPRDSEAPPQVCWEGTANLFVEGDLKEFDVSGGEITYSIITFPTPVAMSDVSYEYLWDGTIQIWERSTRNRKPIRWKTSLGEAKFIDRYFYHDEKIGPDQGRIRIQKCEIRVQTRLSGKVTFKKLIDNLRTEFDNALLLLSFLGRSHVTWYDAEVLFVSDSKDDPNQIFRSARARRGQWLGHIYELKEAEFGIIKNVLLNYEDLRNEAFQQLLTDYEASPYQETIRQAIIHLLVSHERTYLENRYASAFTALECLVYGLGKDSNTNSLLGSSQFKKLSKKLSEVIDNNILDKDLAEAIIEKLPELKRRAFLDQLSRLIHYYNLDLKQFWPPNADTKEEVGRIVKRRNTFFHQGKIESNDLIFDLNRLQNLIELLILKVLSCPDEAINQAAWGHLVPIQRK